MFESWITCVFPLYVISLSDFAYYVFGEDPAVAMYLALWYVLLVCHHYDVCKNSVNSVCIGVAKVVSVSFVINSSFTN